MLKISQTSKQLIIVILYKFPISPDLRSSERSRVEDFAGAADGVAAPGSCTSDISPGKVYNYFWRGHIHSSKINRT